MSCLCGFSLRKYSSMCFDRVPCGSLASNTWAMTSALSITFNINIITHIVACSYSCNVYTINFRLTNITTRQLSVVNARLVWTDFQNGKTLQITEVDFQTCTIIINNYKSTNSKQKEVTMCTLNLINFVPNPLRLSCFENHVRRLSGVSWVISHKILIFTLLIVISWFFCRSQQTLNAKNKLRH